MKELTKNDLDGIPPECLREAEDKGFLQELKDMLSHLAPRGRGVHAEDRRLGAVLCDGGDPAWPHVRGLLKPAVSEITLAKMACSESDDEFRRRLRRAFRALSMSVRIPPVKLDVRSLCQAAFSGKEDRLRILADDYYRRLDGAAKLFPRSNADEHV